MKPTVLIVDDEVAGRKVIESVLLNQGYNLEFAANGRAALEKARTLKPDLLLLDLMMPEMDGLEVCQAIRKEQSLKEMPIVMVTALDDRNTRIACLDAGADDFITKPFDRAELRARVRTITRLNRYRLLHQMDLTTAWIAEKASDGYLQLLVDDTILFANQRARFYLGLDPDQTKLVNEKFMDIVSRQYMPHPAPAWSGWPASIMDAGHNRFLVRPESETAHEFWLEVAIYEMPGDESRPRSRMIRLRDVTSDVLNRRNTRSFGEAITHKIRTPVTHIISGLDLLVNRAADLTLDEIIKFSSTALHGAKRLNDTLGRILKYANLQAGLPNSPGCSINEFKRFAEKIAFELGIENIHVSIDPTVQDIKLTLSNQSVEVLLWELLGNSKKFHPTHNPVVSIDVNQNQLSQVVIQIHDDGITLSPRQLSTVWLPYYQGEKDFTGEAPGMGLGLSTVSTIVWGAGGSCELMNRKETQGVTVELLLPMTQELSGIVSGDQHERDTRHNINS